MDRLHGGRLRHHQGLRRREQISIGQLGRGVGLQGKGPYDALQNPRDARYDRYVVLENEAKRKLEEKVSVLKLLILQHFIITTLDELSHMQFESAILEPYLRAKKGLNKP